MTLAQIQNDLTFGQVAAAPIVTAVVCVILLSVLLVFRKEIAVKLAASTSLDLLYLLILTVAGALGGIMLDLIDLSDAMDNRFNNRFHWQGSILVACVFAGFGSVIFTWYKDLQVKKSLAEAEERDRINRDHERRQREIGKIVATKAQNVRRAARNDQEKKMSRTRLMKILQPEKQMLLNFLGLYECLRECLPPSASLRLALYAPSPDAQQLELEMSYDGRTHDIIASPRDQDASRFRLGNGYRAGCLATYTAVKGGMHVIADTMNLRPGQEEMFTFFDDRQRERIKSIVSFAFEADDQRPFPVLIADTDHPGGFSGDDACFRSMLRSNFEEFGSRLLYEIAVLQLLVRQDPNGKIHAQADADAG